MHHFVTVLSRIYVQAFSKLLVIPNIDGIPHFISVLFILEEWGGWTFHDLKKKWIVWEVFLVFWQLLLIFLKGISMPRRGNSEHGTLRNISAVRARWGYEHPVLQPQTVHVRFPVLLDMRLFTFRCRLAFGLLSQQQAALSSSASLRNHRPIFSTSSLDTECPRY